MSTGLLSGTLLGPSSAIDVRSSLRRPLSLGKRTNSRGQPPRNTITYVGEVWRQEWDLTEEGGESSGPGHGEARKCVTVKVLGYRTTSGRDRYFVH